jgi:hypothetical protein
MPAKLGFSNFSVSIIAFCALVRLPIASCCLRCWPLDRAEMGFEQLVAHHCRLCPGQLYKNEAVSVERGARYHYSRSTRNRRPRAVHLVQRWLCSHEPLSAPRTLDSLEVDTPHFSGRCAERRTSGTPNKMTMSVMEKLDELGCDPIEGLAAIAMKTLTRCRS